MGELINNETSRHAIWLPEEVWEVLLLKVQSSKDLRNWCTAYPSFDNLLHKTKSVWLFEQILPYICPHLTKTNVLTCRQVCKHWRHAVNNLLEYRNRYIYSTSYPDDSKRKCVPPEQLNTWMANNQLLYSISWQNLEIFQKTDFYHHNRGTTTIVGRSVNISFSLTCKIAKYDNFFAHFGKGIWHLKMRSTYNGVTSLKGYIAHILQICPNLKSLVVSGTSWPYEPEPEDQMSKAEIVESYKQALEQIWPKDLELMAFRLRGEYEDIFRSICLSLFCPQQNWFDVVHPTEFAKMTTDDEQLFQLDFTVKSYGQLESLLQLNVPVTTLNLDITYHDFGKEMFQLLVNVINCQRKSLTTLRISFMSAAGSTFSDSSYGCSDVLSLDLPYLKMLTLKWCPTQMSLNSFSNLKSLEYLTIFHHDYQNHDLDNPFKEFKETKEDEEEEEGEVLDIRKRLLVEHNKFPCHVPYFSNLWKIFPKLREFKFGFSNDVIINPVEKLYRGDMYERHDKKCVFENCKLLTCNKDQ